MSLDTTKLINVLNYNMNPVIIQTHVKEYVCTSATSEDSPSINPLSLSEIESLNSKSNAFKIGTLRFSEDIEKEMYEEYLRIVDWKDILTNKRIKEIILNVDKKGLEQIIAIKNISYFERVRGIFYMLKNSGVYDISNRVEYIITARYQELCNQQVNSNLVFTKKETTAIPNVEVDALKEQNKAMQSQIEAMQKMMEQMLAMQSANTSNTEVKEVQTTKTVDTKKPTKQTTKK